MAQRAVFMFWLCVQVGGILGAGSRADAADAAQLLSTATGLTPQQASALLASVAEYDPATLTEGLSAGEAEELLQVAASLAGTPYSAGVHTVGVASPAFREMAEYLEGRMSDHLWQGQMYMDVTYATADRIPGQVVGIGGGGDSAIWSGHYLAAESVRYALARSKRDHAKNHGQAKVWEKEMARAKARVMELVQGAHRNINLSKRWKAKGLYSPAFDAEAGILFRNSFPEGVPGWQQNQGALRHEYTFGPILWEDGRNWYGQGTFTRDQYTGCVLGLLAALDYVAPDDAALRTLLTTDLQTMADYLVRHGWSVVRPETSITDATPAVQPLMNGMRWGFFMVTAARHAAAVSGSLTAQAKWNALWAQSLATQGACIYGEDVTDLVQPSQSYYRFNLAHGHYLSLLRIIPEAPVQQYLRQSLSNLDETTKDDGNAYFEAVTYGITGEQQRLDLAVEHLEQWIPYYARWSEGICNSCHCGTDIDCLRRDDIVLTFRIDTAGAVPQGDGTALLERQIAVDNVLNAHIVVVLGSGSQAQATVSINGSTVPGTVVVGEEEVLVEVLQPGTSTEPRSGRVLRIADERTPQDFLWQRSPYNGSGSMDAPAHPYAQNAGVDFLLPYYLLRYYTEVQPPPHNPFPRSMGISSR